MNTLEAALLLAAERRAVFPLVYGQKVPSRKSNGFKDASTNPARIQRWFGGTVAWNLGVRTGQASGVFVVDEDQPGALAALEAQYGSLPSTRESTTSRGRHFWYKTPLLPIPSSTGRIAPGIDIKAEGGYVCAPPSKHPDGSFYAWIDPSVPIVEPPSWLSTLARKPPGTRACPGSDAQIVSENSEAYGEAALAAEVLALAKTARGGRNNQLNRASFCLHTLVAGGELNSAIVEVALIEAATINKLVADDGLTSVLATIASGRRAGMQHPRNRRPS